MSRGRKILFITMAWWEIIIFVCALILMLGGLIGAILPIIPGVPLIFAAALIYAIIDGFQNITGHDLMILLILGGIAMILDYIAMVFGIKKMGGSYWGVLGSIIGMIAGFVFAGGFVGFIIGSFIGAVLFELLAGKKQRQALKAGFGTFVGFILGGVCKLALAATMIGLFVWNVLVD